jgi:type I restriction enzyme M protein
MTEQKAQLEQQLWIITNTLRGKNDAIYFIDDISPFIFCKYLSTAIKVYANALLEKDHLNYNQVESHAQEAFFIEAIKQLALNKLGYLLLPSELFSKLKKKRKCRLKIKSML